MSSARPPVPSGPTTAADSPAVALRRALGQYPTGVTIVTAYAPDGRAVGLTVNSFASLSLEPPLLLWSLANHSPNRQVFRGATHFAVNVLGAGQGPLALRFADPKVADKFAGVALGKLPCSAGLDRAPVIAGAVASFLCACRDTLVAGDHTLFIGAIEAHACTAADALVFHRGRFTSLLESPPPTPHGPAT